MAKRINLLLTAVLAIICLTALIFAAVPFTAQAAEYEYVKTTFPTVSETPILMLGKYNNLYYAVTANGTSLKVTKVDVVDDKVTTAVTDDMLWIVAKSGNYYTYKSVSKGTYLNLGDWSASLTATPGTFYNGNPLQTTSGNEKFLSITSAAVTYNATTGTQIEAYAQTAKQSGANDVTVSFAKGNDAATGTMEDVSFDKTSGDYTLPECGFTLANYLFKGWKVGDSEEIKLAGDTVAITENTTITAVWELNVWNITYRLEGQTDVLRTVEKTKAHKTLTFAAAFPDYTAEQGKMFSHWVDEGGEKVDADKNYTFTGDKTLTPVFVNAVHITYKGNGGTMSSSYVNGVDAPANSEYKLPSYSNAASLTDYELIGFICEEDGNFYALKSTFQLGETDVTFVAQWRYEGYTLTFKVDGQADNVVLVPITERNMEENTTYTINVNNPTKANADFLGWHLNGDESKLWKKGDTLTTAQLKALTNRAGEFVAQFKEKEMITVTYHFNGETKTEQWEKGKSTLAKFIDKLFPDWKGTATNATFKGWSLKADLSGELFGEVYKTFDADTDLYAVVQIPYVVTFDFGVEDGIRTKNGDTITPVEVFYPHPQSELPEKPGYTLVGWATTKGGAVAYNAAVGVKVTSACTLYAVWDYNYIVVTLKLGAAESVTAETLKGADKTFSIKGIIDGLSETDRAKVLKEHKNLVWKDKDGRTVADDARIEATADVTFTASYTDILYTITFDTNGGNEIAPVSAKFGDAITAPVKPMKKGYTFAGWKDEKGEDFVFSTMPGRNVTLTAGWTEGDDPNPPVIDPVEPSENVKAAKAAMEALTDGLKLKEKLAKIDLADKAIAKLTQTEKDGLAQEITAYNAKVAAVNAQVANVNADLASAENAASALWISVSSALALALIVFVAKRRMF